MTSERPVDETAKAPRRLAALAAAPEWGLFLGIVVVLGAIYLLDSRGGFFRVVTLESLLHQVALFGVLAVGAAVVIIAGGIDLSVGAVVALSAVIAAKLVTSWLPGASSVTAQPPSSGVIAAAIGLTLLLGLAIGLLHGTLINIVKLPPFIATLATMAGLRSLAAIISNQRPIVVPFRSFRMLGSDAWYTVPIFAAVVLAVSIMMGKTVLGRHLYALGGNEAAARLSGLPTGRLKLIAYGISGVLAALAGILFTGKVGQAQSTLGVSYELVAITAAVVGGCSLRGGYGSIRGTVLGLALIQIVIKGTGQVISKIDSTQVEGLVLGTVVVLAVAANLRFRGRS